MLINDVNHTRSFVIRRFSFVGEKRPQDLPDLECVREIPHKSLVEVLDRPISLPGSPFYLGECPFTQPVVQTPPPFGTELRAVKNLPKVIEFKEVHLANKSATPFFNCGKQLKQTSKGNLGVLRTVLNILSERNFEKCWSRTNTWVAEKVTGDAPEISAIVDLLFEKAVLDKFICHLHVKFIQKLSNALLPKTMRASMKDVAKQLALKCQKAFDGKCEENSEKLKLYQLEIEKYSNTLQEKQEKLEKDPKDESLLTTVDVYKNLLREARYVKECAHSKREKGITVLLGHLFLAGLIKEGLVVDNMCSLIKRRTDLSMDCLSELLSVVGQYLENNLVGANGGQKANFNSIFVKIRKISDSVPSGGITFRGKFTAMRILEMNHGKCRKVEVTSSKVPINSHHEEATTDNPNHPAVSVSQERPYRPKNTLLSKLALKNRSYFDISNVKSRPPAADASDICLRPHTSSLNMGPQIIGTSSSTEETPNFSKSPSPLVFRPLNLAPLAPADPQPIPPITPIPSLEPLDERPSLSKIRRSVSSLIHEISEGYAHLDDVAYDVTQIKREVHRMHWVEVFLEQTCMKRRKLDLYGNILKKLVVEAKVISPEILYKGVRGYTVRMDEDYADHPYLYKQAAEVFRALLDSYAFPKESFREAIMNIPGESKLIDFIQD